MSGLLKRIDYCKVFSFINYFFFTHANTQEEKMGIHGEEINYITWIIHSATKKYTHTEEINPQSRNLALM